MPNKWAGRANASAQARPVGDSPGRTRRGTRSHRAPRPALPHVAALMRPTTANDVKQPVSVSRRDCARALTFPPDRGVGGAPTGAHVMTTLARRGASRVRGTLASRRSTVAIFGRGPRFHLRHFLRIRAASSSQPGRSAWRAGPRTSRDIRLRAAAARRHALLRLQDRLRRRPSMSKAEKSNTPYSFRSQ
jgi:hypothetical protein